MSGLVLVLARWQQLGRLVWIVNRLVGENVALHGLTSLELRGDVEYLRPKQRITFDIGQEPLHVRDRYGASLPAMISRVDLPARRCRLTKSAVITQPMLASSGLIGISQIQDRYFSAALST